MKVPIGGGAPTTLASGQDPRGIALDAANVYWTNLGSGTDGTVMSVPIGGGSPVTLVSGQNLPGVLAVDATRVYWTIFSDPAGYGAVMMAPLGGGPATELASGQYQAPTSIAVDNAGVYWTDADPRAISDGAVVKIAKP